MDWAILGISILSVIGLLVGCFALVVGIHFLETRFGNAVIYILLALALIGWVTIDYRMKVDRKPTIEQQRGK